MFGFIKKVDAAKGNGPMRAKHERNKTSILLRLSFWTSLTALYTSRADRLQGSIRTEAIVNVLAYRWVKPSVTNNKKSREPSLRRREIGAPGKAELQARSEPDPLQTSTRRGQGAGRSEVKVWISIVAVLMPPRLEREIH